MYSTRTLALLHSKYKDTTILRNVGICLPHNKPENVTLQQTRCKNLSAGTSP